jgi:hypothetical protein
MPLPAIMGNGQVRSRQVGNSSGVDRHRAKRGKKLVRPAALRHPWSWGTLDGMSRASPENLLQNGRTMTMITITTISSVGTSLAMR